MTDATLAKYLETLGCPNSGRPESGSVTWAQQGLFGGEQRVEIQWSPGRLTAEGNNADINQDQPWKIVLEKTSEGWEATHKQGSVLGGTGLAVVRWAQTRIKLTAADPKPNWEVIPGPSRRKPRH